MATRWEDGMFVQAHSGIQWDLLKRLPLWVSCPVILLYFLVPCRVCCVDLVSTSILSQWLSLFCLAVLSCIPCLLKRLRFVLSPSPPAHAPNFCCANHVRMLFMTCSSNCGCGDSCTNLPFQKLPGSKMKAVKVKSYNLERFFEFFSVSLE